MHQLGHGLTGLLGGAPAAPVERVGIAERLKVFKRIALAEPPEAGLCDPSIVAKHPDRFHRVGGIHELNRAVTLNQGLRRHHLERDPAQTSDHRWIVLPVGLPGVGWAPTRRWSCSSTIRIRQDRSRNVCWSIVVPERWQPNIRTDLRRSGGTRRTERVSRFTTASALRRSNGSSSRRSRQPPAASEMVSHRCRMPSRTSLSWHLPLSCTQTSRPPIRTS